MGTPMISKGDGWLSILNFKAESKIKMLGVIKCIITLY